MIVKILWNAFNSFARYLNLIKSIFDITLYFKIIRNITKHNQRKPNKNQIAMKLKKLFPNKV